MSSVNHKSWGLGTVVKREVLNNGKYTEVEYGGNYITARFDNGKEVRFAIPSSFYTGKLEPMADFADEVADVTEEIESKRQAGIPTWGISDGKRDIDESEERTKKIPAKINVTGNMKEDFKTYLTESGYEPSVVYAYPRAIGIVCAEEFPGELQHIDFVLCRAVVVGEPVSANEIVFHALLLLLGGGCRTDGNLGIKLTRIGRKDGRTQPLGQCKA